MKEKRRKERNDDGGRKENELLRFEIVKEKEGRLEIEM
jgi:hypothetical protein